MGLPAMKRDRVYTYGDYRGWPDEERWELIDGVAWNMSPAPGLRHQRVLIALGTMIKNFLDERLCEVLVAPFDVMLPESPDEQQDSIRTVVQPDLSVICDASKLSERGCTGAPDWVVEILSPHTSRKDFIEKLSLYERHGVREYWIVDPGNQYVHAYCLAAEGGYPKAPAVYIAGDRAESTVLEGFTVELSDLFAGDGHG